MPSSLSFTVSWSLLKFMSIELVILSNRLILCCPFLLLPSIFPSIRVFSNESALCIRWPKYWSFSISVSSEYSGLISFRIDGFDLLTVPGTFKSLLQHNLKAPVFWSSAFFLVHKYPWLTQDHVSEYQVRTYFIFWDIFGDTCQHSTVVFGIFLFGDAEVQKTWLPFLC